jgi:hypothetical protein
VVPEGTRLSLLLIMFSGDEKRLEVTRTKAFLRQFLQEDYAVRHLNSYVDANHC